MICIMQAVCGAKMVEKFLILLVGLPATGKSTYIENHLKKRGLWLLGHTIVTSSDNNIMQLATEKYGEDNFTYDEVFKEFIDQADKMFWQSLENANKFGWHVIVDRTNMGTKIRARILDVFQDSEFNYTKEAVVFGHTLSLVEWMRRMGNRPGKTVPIKTLISMQNNFVMPTREEGFHNVVVY